MPSCRWADMLRIYSPASSQQHMCSFSGPCQLGWAEPLPSGCPPVSASNPNGETFFRFFRATPLVDEHFWSHDKLGKSTGNATPCRARSVSLYQPLEKAKELNKLARWKKHKIAQIKLPNGSGAIDRSDPVSGHVDWWPCAAFKPVASAAMVP